MLNKLGLIIVSVIFALIQVLRQIWWYFFYCE